MGKTLPDGWVENNGPKSWDELLSFAKELTVKSGDTITQSAWPTPTPSGKRCSSP